MIYGGSQERNRRAGTENLPGILSFGLRARALSQNPGWLSHVAPIHHQLWNALADQRRVRLHGDLGNVLPTTINFFVNDISIEEVLLTFEVHQIAIGTGSACSSGSRTPSHVLKAMGCADLEAMNSVRISLGAGTLTEDASRILEVISQLVS
jgi:cysteine desulfurase